MHNETMSSCIVLLTYSQKKWNLPNVGNIVDIQDVCRLDMSIKRSDFRLLARVTKTIVREVGLLATRSVYLSTTTGITDIQEFSSAC